MSLSDDILLTLRDVAEVLEGLGVRWAVGGSFASSAHGEPRATNDIDIVAVLGLVHVTAFVTALSGRFYCEEGTVREAVIRRSSFNLIDERTFVKVDIFVPAPGPMGEGQLIRRERYQPGANVIYVLSAEDVLAQKLRCELGNRVSERQWRDIVSLIRLAGDRLDLEYLTELTSGAGLERLLQDALREASA